MYHHPSLTSQHYATGRDTSTRLWHQQVSNSPPLLPPHSAVANVVFASTRTISDSTYFPGRSANIVFVPNEGEEKIVGSFGILHPEVLANFELTYPASVVEMDLEPFL